MSTTPLGRLLKALRLERGMKIHGLARAVGVSSAFISSIELGKKAAPQTLISKFEQALGLDSVASAEFRRVAELSQRSVEVNMEGQSESSRELAVAFARRFESLDTSQRESIFELLKPKEKSGGN